MPVITISRLFGAGGSEVAAGVARALGWQLLDSTLVDGSAGGPGATPAHVEAVEEHSPSLAERLADALTLEANEIIPASMRAPLPPTEEDLAEATRRVIETEVARGPAVVVGRGAQACLANRPDALHVFCVASRDALIARIMARDGLSADRAADRVEAVNRSRAEYVRRIWHRDVRSPALYDLCINTGTLGIPGAIALVVDASRARFGSLAIPEARFPVSGA